MKCDPQRGAGGLDGAADDPAARPVAVPRTRSAETDGSACSEVSWSMPQWCRRRMPRRFGVLPACESHRRPAPGAKGLREGLVGDLLNRRRAGNMTLEGAGPRP